MIKHIIFLSFLILGTAVQTTQAKEENTAEAAPAKTTTETKPDTESTPEIRDASAFFDESLYDLTEELEIAKEEGKQGILLMFEMDECPFCARMKSTVLNKSNVQDYYREHFRILTIDIEGDIELTDFEGKETTQKDFSLKQFRVRATPVFQFIDMEGKPMKNARLTGATKDPNEFLLLGKYIVEKHNEKQPFFRYKREQASN